MKRALLLTIAAAVAGACDGDSGMAAATSAAGGASSSSSGGGGAGSCVGIAPFTASCNACLEASCCDELIEWGGQPPDAVPESLDRCFDEQCARTCASGPELPAPGCDARSDPAPDGACVRIGGEIACNPVTGVPCAIDRGHACDAAPNGFTCYPPPNSEAVCAACNLSSGTFCAPGLTCLGAASAGRCYRYCCEDEDCGSGSCLKLLRDMPLFPQSAELGVCVE